ncbi:MAG TPA: sulfite exporter TauE/SafE family protein [Polyangiaceae bacterium]|nr:sulfite exporter TauE/SafE family protein [Polyangiaceae bacterium]
MNTASWFGVALASLAGSAHCAAMCGGFVAAYASGEGEAPGRRALSHVSYNAGRLLTYTALGAAAGTLGRALDLAGRAAGLADAAGIVAGGLLLFWGVLGLVPRPALIRLRTKPQLGFTRWVGSLFARFVQQPALLRAGLLGLSTTLLPCGWLYAFVALAAASGGALNGALVMSAFWAGSVPMMLGMGWSLSGVVRRLHSRLPRLRSALILAVGVLTLLVRFHLPAFAEQEAPAAGVRSGAALPRSADCPCHKRRPAAPARVEPAAPGPGASPTEPG